MLRLHLHLLLLLIHFIHLLLLRETVIIHAILSPVHLLSAHGLLLLPLLLHSLKAVSFSLSRLFLLLNTHWVGLHVDWDDKGSEGVSTDDTPIVHDVLRGHLDILTVWIPLTVHRAGIRSWSVNQLWLGREAKVTSILLSLHLDFYRN